MCEICGQSPKAFFEFLQNRARKRRERDKAFMPESEAGYIGLDLHKDPKRPAKEIRSFQTLAYAIDNTNKKRYAGYSGASGGMSRQDETTRENIFIDSQQAKRRLNRLAMINESFDPKKIGIPGLSGGQRPYCRCAEPAAASIAISYGSTLDNLYFVAFKSGEHGSKELDCIFSPCPNCTVFLNKYAAGYFIEKTEHQQTVDKANELEAQGNKYWAKKERHVRRNSNGLIINPGRSFNDIHFSVGGKQLALRCFRCA